MFHLVVLCVLLTTVPTEKKAISQVTAIVTLVSQFFLTALFAGLGSGSWSLRIPSWGALAALSWLSLVFFAVHSEGKPTGNDVRLLRSGLSVVSHRWPGAIPDIV